VNCNKYKTDCPVITQLFIAQPNRQCYNKTVDTILIGVDAMAECYYKQASPAEKRRKNLLIAAACIFGLVALFIAGCVSKQWEARDNVTVTEGKDEWDFLYARPGDSTFRRVVNEDTTGNYFLVYTRDISVIEDKVESLNKLESLLIEADATPLRLPAYIPDGYEYYEAQIWYYLSPNYYDPNMPPTEVQISENGNKMQVFQLPESHREYICSYSLMLTNSDNNQNTGSIIINSSYVSTPSFTLEHITDNEINKHTLDGFDETIHFIRLPQNGQDPYSVIAAWKEIPPVEYYDQNSLPLYYSDPKGKKTNPSTFSHTSYQIEAFLDSNINEDELLKMIKSINS